MTNIDCPALNTFNVFGVEDKPCCYKYHKYCEDVSECSYKKLIQKNNELKESNNVLNEMLVKLNYQYERYKECIK